MVVSHLSHPKRKLYLLWVRFGKQLEIAYVCGKVLGRLIANFDSGPENSQSITPTDTSYFCLKYSFRKVEIFLIMYHYMT